MNNNPSTIPDGQAPLAPESSSNEKLTFDYDKIFGGEEETSQSLSDSDSKKQPSWKTQDAFEDIKRIPNNSSSKSQDFPGSQSNIPRNPLEVISKLQSERDKLRSELEKFQATASEWKSAQDFLTEIEKDAEVRRAFITEMEPELMKSKADLHTLVTEKLVEEFGQFSPNPDEANLFGSKTWLYNERAKELLNEAREKRSSFPKSLKDVREKRKAQQLRNVESAKAEKERIVGDLKWDDRTWESFATWMQTAQGTEFAKIYDHLIKKSSSSSPRPLANQIGSNWKTEAGEIFNELNQFFRVN